MKDLLTITDENHSTCLHSYKTTAEKLMYDYKLRVQAKYYRIVECEFYFSSKKHTYPYVHGLPMQRKTIVKKSTFTKGSLFTCSMLCPNEHNHRLHESTDRLYGSIYQIIKKQPYLQFLQK